MDHIERIRRGTGHRSIADGPHIGDRRIFDGTLDEDQPAQAEAAADRFEDVTGAEQLIGPQSSEDGEAVQILVLLRRSCAAADPVLLSSVAALCAAVLVICQMALKDRFQLAGNRISS